MSNVEEKEENQKEIVENDDVTAEEANGDVAGDANKASGAKKNKKKKNKKPAGKIDAITVEQCVRIGVIEKKNTQRDMVNGYISASSIH